MKFRSYKSIVALLISFALLIMVSSKSAYAFDKSRFFTFLLFASGIGSSVAGTIIQSQANEAYDKYLHTANQTEMENLIDNYEEKHNQSIIASRAGIGIVIGAILISLIDVANMPTPVEQKKPEIFGSESRIMDYQDININFQSGGIALSLSQEF